MFPDSAIDSAFRFSKRKSHYVVNHGLASYFKELLKKDVDKSDVYAVSFNESLNHATQS